jgi:hypothetical protein
MRHVIFDGGARVLWITAFDTDWDPYIDDSIAILGLQTWLDWLRHTEEFSKTDYTKMTSAEVKAYLQSIQTKATSYFNYFAAQTSPQITKALRVQQAFQQVLDSPDAAEALGHPALQPLLDEAAD